MIDHQSKLRKAAGNLDTLNAMTQNLALPQLKLMESIPEVGSVKYKLLHQLGTDAIENCEVAVVIMVGGMATRFGSDVKALAPLTDAPGAPTFLDAHLASLDRFGRGKVDVTLMTSFVTDQRIQSAMCEAGRDDLFYAPQSISLRLNPDGSLFYDADGELSPYTPGHGDLPDALAASKALDRFDAKNIQTVFVVNIDNIGATLDPVVLGMHLESGRAVSAELVSKHDGDRGGIPVSVDGRDVLVEGFRLPHNFPQDHVRVFNTNSLWMQPDLLRFMVQSDTSRTWNYAEKEIDGKKVVQPECAIGEATWNTVTNFIHSPRGGDIDPATGESVALERSRFVIIKSREQLRDSAVEIDAILQSRMGLTISGEPISG